MCGIIGTTTGYKFDNFLLNTISHRGPNARGYFHDQNISLGHVRLSIIDQAGGIQPMIDDDVVLIFNGEIYNYKSIRQELKKEGVRFFTRSDTEVLLRAYKHFGINKTLEKLNGMFAFAIYDKLNKTVCVARDRMGIKPLFYSFVNGFSFSSELSPLVEIVGKHNLTISTPALSMYFASFYIASPLTIWNEIHSLEPGSFIEYHLEKKWTKKCAYWWIPIYDRTEDSIDYLHELLYDSTKLRMNSDVPYGAYLSGGVDSSIITGIMSKISHDQIKTYTAEIRDDVLNEKQYAEIVSKKFNTNHTVLPIEYQDITIKKLKNLLKLFGQPFADSSIVPTYEISKQISQHITVALGGDGSDELFCGYNKYNSFDEGIQNIFYRNKDINRILKNKYCIDVYGYMKDIIGYHAKEDKELLRALDIRFFLEGDILQKVDRLSMANSIEVRVPFLDHRIVEYSGALQTNILFNDIRKFPIKSILEKDFSKDFVHREKIGFMLDTNNFHKFLVSELKSRNTIGKEFIKLNADIYDDAYLSFAVLMFKLWLEDNYES